MILQVRKLVRDLCANYDKTGPTEAKDWCWPEDRVCKFFAGDEPERCAYFERSVLPARLDLQIEYGKHFDVEKSSSPELKPAAAVRLLCRCGKTFARRSNRQELCDECAEARKRQKSRERQWTKRKQKVSLPTVTL